MLDFLSKIQIRSSYYIFEVKSHVENQSGCKIQVLRSDNGKEYTSEKFNLFCEEAGIEHQLTVPYSPQQNGVSEQRNRIIMEIMRCMLHKKDCQRVFGQKQQILLFFFKIGYLQKL